MRLWVRSVGVGAFVVASFGMAEAQPATVRVDKISNPEKTLRFETTVPAVLDEVWTVFTTREGLTTWLAPDARVDLRPGGDWLALFPGGKNGGGTILAFDPGRRLEISALAPEQFPTVREIRTKAVFTFTPEGDRRTKVTLVQSGWRSGGEWDAAYEYLARGNAQLLAQLLRRFEVGPIDWSRPSDGAASPVVVTSSELANGDRILRHEVEIDAPASAAWRAFTTSEGLRGFAAPVAAIDLRLGGLWEASYDPRAQLGEPGNILNEVISFLPERMLSIRIARTPPGFPHPEIARQVWTVIEIADLGAGRSRVSTSMCGWKRGEGWDQVWTFFERGNTVVAESLRDHLRRTR